MSRCDGTIDLSAKRRVEMENARFSGFPTHFWREEEKSKISEDGPGAK